MPFLQERLARGQEARSVQGLSLCSQGQGSPGQHEDGEEAGSWSWDRALPPRARSRSASPLGTLPPKTQGEAPTGLTGGREGRRVLGPVWSMLDPEGDTRPQAWVLGYSSRSSSTTES